MWQGNRKPISFVVGFLFNWNVIVSFHIFAYKYDQRDNGCDNYYNDQEIDEITEVLINDGDPPEKIPKYQDT